jgi:hypothetical protein
MKLVADSPPHVAAENSSQPIKDQPTGRGVRAALLAYAALVPIAWQLALVAPGRKDWPVWMFAAVLHGVLCAVIAHVTEIVFAVLERLRSDVRYEGEPFRFVRALAVWPVIVAIWMIIRKLTS